MKSHTISTFLLLLLPTLALAFFDQFFQQAHQQAPQRQSLSQQFDEKVVLTCLLATLYLHRYYPPQKLPATASSAPRSTASQNPASVPVHTRPRTSNVP
ncbi:hypothetical protein T439DRAFT_358772 [Meredithblackwellia eburnea MCA 4105]